MHKKVLLFLVNGSSLVLVALHNKELKGIKCFHAHLKNTSPHTTLLGTLVLGTLHHTTFTTIPQHSYSSHTPHSLFTIIQHTHTTVTLHTHTTHHTYSSQPHQDTTHHTIHIPHEHTTTPHTTLTPHSNTSHTQSYLPLTTTPHTTVTPHSHTHHHHPAD